MNSPTVLKYTWIAKGQTKTLLVLNAFAASNTNSWYFDSGCSKHMFGHKSVFSSLSPFDGGTVTFGRGHKSQVVGKGNVCIPGLPNRAYNVYNYRIGTIIWSTTVSIDDFTPSTKMASDEDGLLSPMPKEESLGLDLVVDLTTFSKPVDLSTLDNSGPVDL
ncbi:unnamed protein product [Prunus brigantina]